MSSIKEECTYWAEYKEYISEIKTSSYEKRLLRDWVRSGHSVYETVQSRYLTGPSEPPMDFLDAYRFDRELRETMQGMTKAEKEAYLKAFMGYEDPVPEQGSEIPLGQ